VEFTNCTSRANHNDQENLNILRDAAHLQSQLRIYDSLVDTRYTILKLRPSLRQNWLALAVAYNLNGNLTDAKKVLEQYEHILKVCGILYSQLS
jgi:N-alpha-acetyltransferase 15/16, NatA auxiliary subunit